MLSMFNMYYFHRYFPYGIALTILTYMICHFESAHPGIAHAIANASLDSLHFRPHTLQSVSQNAEISTLYLRSAASQEPLGLYENLDLELPPFAPLNDTSVNHDRGSKGQTNNVRTFRVGSVPDASNILFGVATYRDRLYDSLDNFAHWAANTGTTIIVLLPPDTVEDKFVIEFQRPELADECLIQKARTLGFSLVLHEREGNWEKRYISLLEVLWKHSSEKTQWISLIDDDTFFPSLSRLVAMLNRYDPSQPQYVGGLTEALKGLQGLSMFAMGGAGVFMSKPLVQQLMVYYPACVRLKIKFGDARVAHCIYRFTSTKLSVELGLHQIDIRGDHSGFYEAVRPLPVSVHHWKSWAHIDMGLVSAISPITGPESIFQKYHLQDGWWLTNGFSIVKYSDEEPLRDAQYPMIQAHPADAAPRTGRYLSHRSGSMEQTFRPRRKDDWKQWLHSLEPLRPKDENKKQYLIEEVVRENSHTMSQYYVHRMDGVADSIIRIVWTDI